MTKSNFNDKIIGLLTLFVSIGLFIIISYFLKNNFNLLENFVFGQGRISGMFYYVLFSMALVIAPLASSIPLIPVASLAWGWVISGLLTSLAWIIGTQILFEFARRFGKPLFGRIISQKQLNKIQNILQKKNFTLQIIFLRTFFYDDILSYALGIFTNMKRSRVFFVNAAGAVAPAFLLAYFGTLALKYQLALLFVAMIFFYFAFYGKNNNGNNDHQKHS